MSLLLMSSGQDGPQTVEVGIAVETDTALAASILKVAEVGIATETDTGLAATSSGGLTVGGNVVAEPTAGVSSGLGGNVVVMPTTSDRWNKEIQRAEGDGTGSPVGGTETIITTVWGMQTKYVDVGSTEPLDGAKSYIYRHRFNRPGGEAGTWSAWTGEKRPADLESQTDPPLDGRGILRDTDEREPPSVSDTINVAGAVGIATSSFELYTYDTDTDNAGGVVVGARLQGTGVGANAGDFTIRKAGETVTVPGSEVSASAATDYYVYWERDDSTVSITTTKPDVMDWRRIWLTGPNADGTITSASDITDGTSSTTDSGGGSGTAGRDGFQ